MSAQLHAKNFEDNPVVPTQNTADRGNKRPGRSLTILITLALVALGLMVLPRPTLYYPNVVIETAGGMQLDFLLNGQNKSACETTVASIVSSITTTCTACVTRSQTCIKNLSAGMRQRFDETPLPMPSARMANGIVTYSDAQTKTALLTCQESERQAVFKGDQAKVACYPAGAARPHTSFEKHNVQTGHNTFTLLIAIVGGLVASLITAILITYYRHTAFSARHSVVRTHPWLEKSTLAGVDTLILLSTFLALSWPATDDINSFSHLDRATVTAYGLVVILTIGWFWLHLEHYTRRRPFWDELREVFRMLAVMFMVSSAVAFVVGLDTVRSSHLIVWALNFALIPLGRAGTKHILDDMGLWQRPAIIIGTGENAREAYRAIKSERGMGYCVIGFVKDNAGQMERQETLTIGTENFPILDASQSVDSLINALGNPQIIIALDSLTNQENQILVQGLLTTHANVHVIPSIRGLPLFGTQLSHFFSHEVLFLTVRNNLSRRGYIWIKRLFDLVIASLLMILLSPLFIVLSFLIRRDGGKAFYIHTRIGHNGKPFRCLKFRSMKSDADNMLKDLLENDPAALAEWDRDFKLKNDPRTTTVGNFLRKTSLDELPQLINVIKGEMSLVGPRPIVAAELERYGNYASLFLQVLPGVTGLWQVSGRNDTSYSERVTLDAWYVQNWSLWYDIAILFKTVGAILNRRGAY